VHGCTKVMSRILPHSLSSVCVCVCVCVWFFFNFQSLRYILWAVFPKPGAGITPKQNTEKFYLIHSENGDDNMANVQTCEVGVTLASQ